MLKNKIHLAIAFVFSLIHVANGQDIDSAYGKLTIIRPYYYLGFADANYFIFNDSLKLRFYNNTYYSMVLPIGKYKYILPSTKESDEITIDSAQHTYLLLQYGGGPWRYVPIAYNITQKKGDELMQNYRPKDIRRPLIRPTSRVAAYIGGGFGFNDIPVITTTDNRPVYIGFGGGFTAGLEFGNEVSKYFEMALGYRYVTRGLEPSIKNGSMTFSRHIFSASPTLIIPIQGGYMQRMKISTGLDFAIGNKLEIKTAGIPGGLNDTWKYKEAFGFHVKWVYEINYSDNVSQFFGIRYANMSYQFDKGMRTFPIDNKFIKPDAEAFEFLLGIQYHF
jgi:hypothetical protein